MDSPLKPATETAAGEVGLLEGTTALAAGLHKKIMDEKG